MKKLLLPLALLAAVNSFAQPTINQSQFPLAVGDVLANYAQTYTPPTTGASQTWNYTGFTTTSPTTVSIVSPAASGISGLPTTTLCFNYGGVYDCYNIDATTMERTGASSGGNGVVYYNPEKVVSFPITYPSTNIDHFRANFLYGGAYNAHRSGVDSISVVGYGTLQLPASVTYNNAMLVKTHEVYTDSVDLSGTWLVIHYNYTTYNFYAAGHHSTVVTTTSGGSDFGGNIQSTTYTTLAPGSGLEAFDVSNNLELYPNPAENNFILTNHGNILLTGFAYKIVNMQGQVIETGILNEDNLNFDVSSYTPGMYIMNIQGGNFNASKRFIKK